MSSFEQDVFIDPNALEVEWLEQPTLMGKYTKQQADAKKEYDLAQEELSLVRAGLDKEIRTDPEAFDIEIKVTEAVVTNTILQQLKYQKVAKQVTQARYEYEIAKAAVQSLEHKRTALENLVKLFASHYFAGPSVPHIIDKEWQKRGEQKTVDKKVRIGRRK